MSRQSEIRKQLGLDIDQKDNTNEIGNSIAKAANENAARKKKEEEERRRREQQSSVKETPYESKKVELKATEFQDPNPTSFTNFTEPSKKTPSLPQGRGSNRDSMLKKKTSLTNEHGIRRDSKQAYREEQQRVLSKNKDFATDLISDLQKTQQMESTIPMNERKKDFTPAMIQNVDDYFKVIEYSIRPGQEKVIQNMGEGAAQRIVQNALSQENVRKMQNLPNKVEEIEKWLSDHPELDPNANLEGEKQSIPMRSTRGFADIVTLGLLSKAQALPDAGKYAAAGAVTGGVLGNFVPGGIVMPEEALTIPAGAALGFRYGMTTGSAKYMMQLEAGSSYAEL